MSEQVRLALAYAGNNIPQSVLFSKNFACDTNGAFVDEAVSGWSRNFLSRPAGRALNEQLQPGDHIVVYSIDRMCRSVRDFCNLTAHFQQKGVFLHFVADSINTATASGRFQSHIRAAMAQYSSDLLSERMREAWAIKRLREGKKLPRAAKRLSWENSEWVADVKSVTGRAYGTIHIYERVSSVSQYTSGLSLENQSIANAAYAARLAGDTVSRLGETFREDAISAFSVKFQHRPEGKRLLEALRPGDDVVIYRSDRAFRNPGDALEVCQLIKEKGAFVHLVTENIRTDVGTGADWIGVLASMAHLESTLKSRRVREAHDYCRRHGRPVGTTPKGFKAVISGGKKKLSVDKQQVFLCAMAVIMREERGQSINETMDALVAMKCELKGKKATLREYSGHSIVAWHMEYAERLQKQLPEAIWEEAVAQARDRLSRPIQKKYWIVPSWQWPAGVLAA